MMGTTFWASYARTENLGPSPTNIATEIIGFRNDGRRWSAQDFGTASAHAPAFLESDSKYIYAGWSVVGADRVNNPSRRVEIYNKSTKSLIPYYYFESKY